MCFDKCRRTCTRSITKGTTWPSSSGCWRILCTMDALEQWMRLNDRDENGRNSATERISDLQLAPHWVHDMSSSKSTPRLFSIEGKLQSWQSGSAPDNVTLLVLRRDCSLRLLSLSRSRSIKRGKYSKELKKQIQWWNLENNMIETKTNYRQTRRYDCEWCGWLSCSPRRNWSWSLPMCFPPTRNRPCRLCEIPFLLPRMVNMRTLTTSELFWVKWLTRCAILCQCRRKH